MCSSKMNTKLLDIQPQELKFIFELKKQSSCCVRLINNSNHHVAFKFKTTSPKKYCVKPNKGTINPKSTCEVAVTMHAQRLVPPDMICEDKFLVQSTVVPVGATNKDITASTFAKDDGKYIEESKLRVILVRPPNLPVPSPINGTLKEVPNSYVNCSLLDIQPQVLKFILELKKQSSRCVRLINNSDNHVAFKVKTTSPKNYCVRPNRGTINPKSTCEFTVTMQAQQSAPSDVICKDKFLIQSTVVPVGTTNEDIRASTFAKDDGKYIEESKLRVILVLPPNSPAALPPINKTLKHVPAYKLSMLKDQLLNKVAILRDQLLRKFRSLTQRHTQEPAYELLIPKDQVPSKVGCLTQRHTNKSRLTNLQY